jgi:hypothetical protein
MVLTKSPIFLHDPDGPTPWSALGLRFFRRSFPPFPRNFFSPPSGPATGSFNSLHL